MARGGARPGAGAPKGKPMKPTIDKALMREALRLIVAKHLEEMTLAQIQAAKGYALIDKSDENGEKTYDVGPNPQAFKTLIDHAIGKAPESLDVTSDGERIFCLPGELIAKNGINEGTSGDSEV